MLATEAARHGVVLSLVALVLPPLESLGGNLAEHLARSGWTSLRLVDSDLVTAGNLACQPYAARQVGQPKVRALADGGVDVLWIETTTT